ncbi:MAG: hypothetical protein RR724_01070 [Hydrogenoanaerobacterium sp.]
MPVFIFKILPLLALAALVACVVLTSMVIARGNKKFRIIGIVCIVAFVLIICFVMLQALARM